LALKLAKCAEWMNLVAVCNPFEMEDAQRVFSAALMLLLKFLVAIVDKKSHAVAVAAARNLIGSPVGLQFHNQVLVRVYLPENEEEVTVQSVVAAMPVPACSQQWHHAELFSAMHLALSSAKGGLKCLYEVPTLLAPAPGVGLNWTIVPQDVGARLERAEDGSLCLQPALERLIFENEEGEGEEKDAKRSRSA